eukprot:TRINITY_DN4159_c0_g1_i2.p1 TRINITY_DN4159_c0_g1~~TRINITY_DN4159_c0_g1_i2.p1  ORF type:complete len:324 (-),score=40.39 TRINITY_DN4159_c0_g1_i2:135-1106(-)
MNTFVVCTTWLTALLCALLQSPGAQALREETPEQLSEISGSRAAKDQCIFYNFKELEWSDKVRIRRDFSNSSVVDSVCKDSINHGYAEHKLSMVENDRQHETLGILAIDSHTKEICGFTFGYVTDKNSYHTSLICSHMGYGKKLLEASFRWAQNRGIELADLEAVPDALGFYEKQKFTYCKDACQYRCDNRPRSKDQLYYMSRCIKDRSESAISWGPGTVDLSTRLSSKEAGGERFWNVSGRHYRCCCKKGQWCKMVDVSARFHFPVSVSTSTCGRYIRNSHSWNSHSNPLENTCVVLREEVPEDLLPELGDLLSDIDSTGQR